MFPDTPYRPLNILATAVARVFGPLIFVRSRAFYAARNAELGEPLSPEDAAAAVNATRTVGGTVALLAGSLAGRRR